MKSGGIGNNLEKNLKNYTRGSQSTAYSINLFKKSIKKMFTVMFLCVVVAPIIWYCVKSRLMEQYFIFKSAEAVTRIISSKVGDVIIKGAGSTFLAMTYKEGSGKVASISAYDVINSGISKGIYATIFKQIKESALIGFILSILLNILLWIYLSRKGKKLDDEEHLRGGTFEEEKRVAKQIKKQKIDSTYKIANVPLIKDSETQHIMITGSTGTGKTTCISSLLDQIRTKKQMAVIYDKKGVYTERYYREGKDILLNPLDTRFVGWHLWAECKEPSDFDSMAEAFIPMPVTGTDPFWINAARIMFSVAARKLAKENPSTSQLLRYLLMADLNKIKEIFTDTEAESLVSEDAAKMALSVKAVLAVNLRSLLYLEETDNPLSIRDWIRSNNEDRWIFITSRQKQHSTLKPLIVSWINVATNELLSLPINKNNKDRRVWMVLDELSSLHAIPSLPEFMGESREYGGCAVLAFHSILQLHRHYGQLAAEEVLELCNTSVHFRSSLKTADFVSNVLQKKIIKQKSESISYGSNIPHQSTTEHEHEKSIVIPSEVSILNDLEAYLRLKGDIPITKIKFNYKEYLEVAPRYLEKRISIDREVEDVINGLPQNPVPIKEIKTKAGNKRVFNSLEVE